MTGVLAHSSFKTVTEITCAKQWNWPVTKGVVIEWGPGGTEWRKLAVFGRKENS
jgi:hypothetical protein